MRKRTARFVRTAALYRGVLGGSRPWQVVFVVLTLGRVRRRVLGREPALAAREVLVPGESVQIRALGVLPRKRKRRRQRDKAMKAAAKAQT